MPEHATANILLVTPTPARLGRLTSTLSEVDDFCVRNVADVALASAALAVHWPDLILLDADLPERAAYTFCRSLQASSPARDVPVIFVDVWNEGCDRSEGFAVGGADYLSSPFPAPEVHARVRTHLELARLRNSVHCAQLTSDRGGITAGDDFGEPLRMLGAQVDITIRKRAEEALQLTQFAVDHASVAVAWAKADGRYLYVNQQMCRMLGYSRAQLLEMHVMEVNAEAAAVEMWHAHWRELKAKGSLTYEARRRHSSGRIFPIEISANYFEYAGEGYSIAFVRDISERKQTEKALQLTRLCIMRASDAIFWIRPDGRFIDVNVQACAALGYARDELLGMAVWDIDPNLVAAQWPPHWQRTRELKTRRFETLHRRKDSSLFPVEITANSVEYDGEEYDFAFARDISERRRAETALRESEVRLRTAIESIPFDVFLIGADGRYVLQNTESRKHWGDVVGKYPAEVTDDGETLMHWDSNNRRAFAGEIIEEEACIAVAGEERCFTNIIAPIKDDHEIRGIVGLNIDITERKRAEQELQRHREHLEELVSERTAALRQAMHQLVQAEKLAALGHLVAGVAHELNTPLGNARLVAGTLGEHLHEFASTVESGTLRRSHLATFLARAREAVELLARNTARAADLVGQFKQVAVDQTSMRRRPFDLRQTIEELLVALRPQFKRSAHRIELDIPTALHLDSYPGPLEQVISNLIGNSLIHGFVGIDAGCIGIDAAPVDAGHIRLCYRDNGTGIPEPILNRIFEPFFTTRLGCGGSGLGLYIAYNLVTGVLGGTVAVRSQPGQGTVFDLVLPMVAPSPTVPGQASLPPGSRQRPHEPRQSSDDATNH
ncbi:MAG: PAS domain S-box protein [Candidatus Accumulibacter sp.]|nr:PAS domain S-box protein [Accumulibacter sp.]